MHSTDNFTEQLKQLSDIDHIIKSELSASDINTEEITELVDKREQLLQRLLCTIDELPQLSQTEQWQQAIKETQNVVLLMQSKTTLIGQTLYKYRHGNKSVQQYKKFL
ncbi:flagellar protein FliT [Vibrio scophthalmi]|uniref:Polar flagellar rod protein FlaI n=1 Tax=Vibrio scophthalmi LMG 19158 TaxID=870967 RepID=F9RT19_9VIBR|nr:flagellar protein FliT [Vibrio scophthalmi]EGU31528.1 polar flagellar rod protein FlaI [Vibrio scophthalmi LMG 19158]